MLVHDAKVMVVVVVQWCYFLQAQNSQMIPTTTLNVVKTLVMPDNGRTATQHRLIYMWLKNNKEFI